MNIIKKTIVVSVMLASSAVSAGDDLVSIYQQALQNDPTLKAEQKNLLATQELPKQARAVLLPKIDLKAHTTRNETRSSPTGFSTGLGLQLRKSFNSHDYTLTLRQPVYNHTLFVGVKQVKALVNQALLNYTAADQELIIRTADRYFAVLAADDDLAFAEAEKTAIERQLEQARQRFEVGLIAITDIHEAQARFDQAVAAQILADNLATRSREALREITFIYYQHLATLRDESPLATPEPSNIDVWVYTAMEQNARVQAQVYGVKAALQDSRRIRAGHFPTVDLVGTHTYNSANSGRFSNGKTTSEDTMLSIEVKLPIFAGGLVNSQTREAGYRHAQAKDLLEVVQRQLVRQTRDAYWNIGASLSSVIALRQARLSSQSAL
ncbi:MAG: TolC family outer membrane protein, partial [Immundisolibacteraceae bacterium]|nr:TolC family outer membrane protein [Immundisolibacteraceae bacterium]